VAKINKYPEGMDVNYCGAEAEEKLFLKTDEKFITGG
jgi:hypothetical protein